MTAPEIKAEIEKLLPAVRFSKKPESDEAARKICRLEVKLKELKK